MSTARYTRVLRRPDPDRWLRVALAVVIVAGLLLVVWDASALP